MRKPSTSPKRLSGPRTVQAACVLALGSLTSGCALNECRDAQRGTFWCEDGEVVTCELFDGHAGGFPGASPDLVVEDVEACGEPQVCIDATAADGFPDAYCGFADVLCGARPEVCVGAAQAECRRGRAHPEQTSKCRSGKDCVELDDDTVECR